MSCHFSVWSPWLFSSLLHFVLFFILRFVCFGSNLSSVAFVPVGCVSRLFGVGCCSRVLLHSVVPSQSAVEYSKSVS